MNDKVVYVIIDRESGEQQGSYARACHDEMEFSSVERARGANCHDKFKDKEKYAIAKYKVIYQLLEEDCA